MKNLLASLLALIGIGSSAQPQQKIQTLDPGSILFSTPTISNDTAALEPVARALGKLDLVFHEDEWSQVEFFPKAQLPDIKRILLEYKAFEQMNRTKNGWRKVFVRRVERASVVSGAQPVQRNR